jgi:hypothetical protein
LQIVNKAIVAGVVLNLGSIVVGRRAGNSRDNFFQLHLPKPDLSWPTSRKTSRSL